MTTRIAINGFGRIGRQTLRAILERHPDELEVAAVNDLAPSATNAHLFRYDSTYGRYPGTVEEGDVRVALKGRGQVQRGRQPIGDWHLHPARQVRRLVDDAEPRVERTGR